MKNLIKKILRESDDWDWDWVRDIVGDERITKYNVEVGMRVRMNPDSEFVQQTKPNGHGTVSHIRDDYFPSEEDEKYWVYVDWDDGTRNSYSVGDVEFDLLFPNEKPPIKESDELDWIRTTDTNPWMEYDGIHFDIEPSEGDVFKYIEMALNSLDVLNSHSWFYPHEDDIYGIIEYFRNKKIVYLIIDNKGRLSYGTSLSHWIGCSEFNLIKYSQLNDGDTITESDELDWIRSVEPTIIQINESYIMTTYDLQQFLTTVERELPLAKWCSGDKPTEYSPLSSNHTLKNSKEHYIKIIINDYHHLSYSFSGPEDFNNSINWP